MMMMMTTKTKPIQENKDNHLVKADEPLLMRRRNPIHFVAQPSITTRVVLLSFQQQKFFHPSVVIMDLNNTQLLTAVKDIEALAEDVLSDKRVSFVPFPTLVLL